MTSDISKLVVISSHVRYSLQFDLLFLHLINFHFKIHAFCPVFLLSSSLSLSFLSVYPFTTSAHKKTGKEIFLELQGFGLLHYENKLIKNIRPTDILEIYTKYLVNFLKFTKYIFSKCSQIY